MKEKSVTFFSSYIKNKIKSKFIQNLQGESDFSEENLGLSFKVNVYSFSFPLKPYPWCSRKVKQEIIIRNWTYQLRHNLPNNLGLMIFRNRQPLRLFTWVFIDLMIRGFELATRRFELTLLKFQIVLLNFQLVLLSFQLVTPTWQLLIRNSCFTISQMRLTLQSVADCY